MKLTKSLLGILFLFALLITGHILTMPPEQRTESTRSTPSPEWLKAPQDCQGPINPL